MKKLLLIILALTLTIPAWAELTPTEEFDLRDLLTRKAELEELAGKKDTLVLVADGITDETIPRQIKLLEKDIDALIAARDAEITAENVLRNDNIRTIESNYETQIDAKEGEITTLRNSL